MIKIVAIKTAVAKIKCTSKTLVNLFQLMYIAVALFILTQFQQPFLQRVELCVMTLFALFVLRLVLRWLPKVCGDCGHPLGYIQQGICSECKNYNTFDLKLWSKLKFQDMSAVHHAETNWFVQNMIALLVVSIVFLSPLAYFIFVVDKDIHQVNQQRQVAFQQIRGAFLKYNTKHHKYPDRLEQLIPHYISKIPTVLITPKKNNHGSFRIDYQIKDNIAQFIFHASHAPISKISYHVGANQYQYDSKWVEWLWGLNQLH